jgi:predicted RecB family nuclease
MRLAKKRYLNSKSVYEYERISLHIPRKFHGVIKPYLEEDLDLTRLLKDWVVQVEHH